MGGISNYAKLGRFTLHTHKTYNIFLRRYYDESFFRLSILLSLILIEKRQCKRCESFGMGQKYEDKGWNFCEIKTIFKFKELFKFNFNKLLSFGKVSKN